jgi:hypothetical protein
LPRHLAVSACERLILNTQILIGCANARVALRGGDAAACAPKRGPSIRPSKPSGRSSSITVKSTPSPYHRSKLTLLRRNPQHQRSLASFLKKVPASCPTICFVATTIRRPAPRKRSQRSPISLNCLITNRKENTATETAALIIPAVGNNKLRHETLQNFILVNDSSTIAAEIPILGSPRTRSANSKRATALSSRRWDA